MNSFIPWVGGKGKLLWIINKMAPERYSRFIDVFGGSGTVTMNRPTRHGCMEVYNDFNGNLTNLFCCVKSRTLALLSELGFLPLNTRDDFNVLYKFFSRGEFTDDYLQEEMSLTDVYLKPPDAEAIRALMLERAPRGDIRRAADYFKLVRYSFSGSAKSFGGKPCDIRRFFHLIWECSRRLANVIVENKDFEDVIRQYDREDAWIYCDPPYFEAECYEVGFPKVDHQRLHDTLLNCRGYVMVSYNYCPYISELYKEFFIFRTVRPNSMSQTAGSEYEEANATYKALMRATISEALGLNGDPEEVDMLERKIEALNNKMLALVNESVSSGDGIEAHESEFMTLSQETELLKQRIAAIQESTAKDNGEQNRLEQIQAIISERESKCMEYDDSIVRQMVECIKVYPGGKLEIIFGGGYLVEESV